MFTGFISLGSTILVRVVALDASDTPTNASALPTWRAYNGTTFLLNGITAFLHTGTITNVTNNGSGACRITSASHNVQTGSRVTVTGVAGATGANTTASATRIDANTFDMDGTTFGGAYTSGGTFNTTGEYSASVAATAGNGFAAGDKIDVFFDFTVSVAKSAHRSFAVT